MRCKLPRSRNKMIGPACFVIVLLVHFNILCQAYESPASARIIGGRKVEYLWQTMYHVALLAIKGKSGRRLEYVCGSTILHQKYLVTTAHCVISAGNLTSGQACKNLRFMGGRASLDFRYSHMMKQRCKNVHTPYDEVHEGDDDDSSRDIALIELNNAIEFANAEIGKAYLPFMGEERLYRFGYLAGYGRSYQGVWNSISFRLKVVRLPIRPYRDCQKVNFPFYLGSFFPEFHLCVGYKSGTPAVCDFDEGGGFIVAHPERPQSYIILGILTANSAKHRCGAPDAYASVLKVSKYTKWISQYTFKNI